MELLICKIYYNILVGLPWPNKPEQLKMRKKEPPPPPPFSHFSFVGALFGVALNSS